MIHSDWHIHSEASYDASLLLKEIADGAKKFGFKSFGITDHANLNDEQFLGDLKKSVDAVTEFQKENPQVVLGVELTPIAKPEFTYMQKHHNLEGYVAPVSSELYGIELACTKEELIAMGVRYAIGASHWRVDIPNGRRAVPDRDACIKEWYRQQMWLAADERVTILGHPWYNGKGLWYEDFAVVPYSMKMDVAEVLKAHGKYAECNAHFFCTDKATEKFRHQYAEFLRELFEMGIRITYGSDAHKQYTDAHHIAEKYLAKAGFVDGDIVGLSEVDLW